MARPFQDGATFHSALVLDEDSIMPDIHDDTIMPPIRDNDVIMQPIEEGETLMLSVEEDDNTPSVTPFNTYTIESDSSDVEEIEHHIIPNDDLLINQHPDEARPNLGAYVLSLESWKAEIESHQVNGVNLRAGGSMTVSFRHDDRVEFLTILYLRQDLLNEEDVTLIGHRFLKTNDRAFGGLLDATRKDEVAWVITKIPGNELGHLYEVSADSVIAERRIAMTNAPTPRGSKGVWNVHEDLVCRWKVIVIYPKSSPCKPRESVVRKLRAAECHPKHHISEEYLRRLSRGKTIRGGSAYGCKDNEQARLQKEAEMRQRLAGVIPTRVARTQRRPTTVIIDDESDDAIEVMNTVGLGHAHVNTPATRRYTFGDAFCGAGGVSRGAQMAGLSVAWGFDHGPDQCETWSTNFPYGKIYRCDVTTFLGAPRDVKVDILHLSPPCQPYSPANTRPNEAKNWTNIQTCFAIADLIEKCKPRLVTMENTSGLYDRSPEWFHPFVSLFLHRDFDVRWSLVNMANFGVPQSRQRLIIIAACPGEILPTFPPCTHMKVAAGANAPPGLSPWVTINAALSNIPPICPDHDVLQAMCRGNGAKPPPDGNSVAKCVTCKGGDNDKHPDGDRGYTNREFACLQTFPLYHEFRPLGVNKITTIREQIGNAVPPRFGKVLFTWLRKSLERADGVARPDVMEID